MKHLSFDSLKHSNRIWVNTVPRSGATVFVNECFRNYAVVDEPFAGYTANTHLMNRLTDHAQRQQRSLRELLTQSASIVLKHHAAQTRIESLPTWCAYESFTPITYIRRDLFQTVASYSLAVHKTTTFRNQTDYFRPGSHENIKWSVPLDQFERNCTLYMAQYQYLMSLPRTMLFVYEDIHFSDSRIHMQNKSHTIANLQELHDSYHARFGAELSPHLQL